MSTGLRGRFGSIGQSVRNGLASADVVAMNVAHTLPPRMDPIDEPAELPHN